MTELRLSSMKDAKRSERANGVQIWNPTFFPQTSSFHIKIKCLPEHNYQLSSGMRLLLIRHGETVDNVAGNYAGVLDSALTTHGALQTARLGAHLASSGVNISHIYSSDLQRAVKTAQAIRLAQATTPPETVKLEMLREQDFGWWEGKAIVKGGRDGQRLQHCLEDGFKDIESKASMKERMETFITVHLLPHIHSTGEYDTVAVVAHGIILSYLWRTLLKRFDAKNVTVSPEVILSDRGLEYMGGWSNTGYLDLEIKHPPSRTITVMQAETSDVAVTASSRTVGAGLITASLSEPAKTTPIVLGSTPPSTLLPGDATGFSSKENKDLLLVVKSFNILEHLKGLKKTRGGIGSARHDDKQRTMDSFFKRRKME